MCLCKKRRNNLLACFRFVCFSFILQHFSAFGILLLLFGCVQDASHFYSLFWSVATHITLCGSESACGNIL